MKHKDKSKAKHRPSLAINIISLTAVFLFMASAALMQSGRIFGYKPGHFADGVPATAARDEGDTITINTTDLASDVTGYSGPVPVEIKIVKGIVVAVKPLDNVETPDFFRRVTESGITDKWNGLTVENAAALHVDGVTGATYSSTALIRNVQAGLNSYLSQRGRPKPAATAPAEAKTIEEPKPEPKPEHKPEPKPEMQQSGTEETPVLHDTVTINTTDLGADIIGYNGPVPLEIKIADGKVISVTPLPNSETPRFFRRVTESGITDLWNGLTAEKAAALHVDGVTGATYSSTALIRNVQAGLESYLKEQSAKPVAPKAAAPKAVKPAAAPAADEKPASPAADTAAPTPAPASASTISDTATADTTTASTAVQKSDTAATDESGQGHSPAFFAALAVLITAMSVPLFTKNQKYRIVQQLLNAGVLGFWAGSFVNYTMMLSIIGSGITASTSVIALLMLVCAFIYPLFGKQSYYCTWVCPLGSLQELALHCNPHHHLKLSGRAVKILSSMRLILWAALMVCLWTGFWMSWIDYELFSAFLVGTASVGVIIAGAAIIVISIFIPRPYCRFICPTGTLLHLAQDSSTK